MAIPSFFRSVRNDSCSATVRCPDSVSMNSPWPGKTSAMSARPFSVSFAWMIRRSAGERSR